MDNIRLTSEFYCRDVLEVAPALLGKKLVRSINGIPEKFLITEVEAYRGEEDEACHARFGKTQRNAIMYESGGFLYIYMIYGMYWMLNIVTGNKGFPQAALIRGIEGYNGPGKLTKALRIDRTFYGEDLNSSVKLWIENQSDQSFAFVQKPRVGIDYAGEPWKNIAWRFILK